MIGFLSILGVIFIALKIYGVVLWPWVWVISPLWIEFIVLISLVIYAWRIK